MTALWDAQLADIITLTNHPELVDDTALALRQATLRAHACDHFVRDLVISPILVGGGASSTLLVIPTTASFPRFRDVSAVQLLDVNSAVLDFPEVCIVEANDTFEYSYPGVRKPYVSWLAGTNLNVYAACGMFGAQISWFQSPNLTSAAYDSWIAQLFPDVIVWEAAMNIWTSIGNADRAASAFRNLHGDQHNPETGLYGLLKSNFLTTAGR